MATRTLSFRLYPSRRQADAMVRKQGLLKDLWNAALEERIGAGRQDVRISRSNQGKALKVVGAELSGWRGLIHTHEA